MSSEDTLLSIEHLSITFRGRALVDDVSLEILRGQRVALVGESGSGKSVLARSVLRLNGGKGWKITGGIKLNGVDLLQLSTQQMDDIRGGEVGMVFQEPAAYLNPTMRVLDQVIESGRTHRGRAFTRDLAMQRLAEVGLGELPGIDRAYPHELSGGQKQRVMIAMAMSCDPGLIVADEPTTALDVTVQARVLEILNEVISRRHGSVLFITHDLGVVADFCDYVYVMKQGVIVEHGTKERIFLEPREEYTRMLLNSAREIAGLDPLEF